MKWILLIATISLLLMTALHPDGAIAAEGVTDVERAETTEAAASSEGETATNDAQADAAATPSSLLKKMGAWGAAGAIVGSVAPGPGNIVGFICGIAAGAVHHLISG